MDRQPRFVFAQTIWMLCSVLGLVMLDALTLRVFVILSFIGLLVITELTAPLTVVPHWRVRIRWVVLWGLSAVAYVMIRRILEVVPSGTF